MRDLRAETDVRPGVPGRDRPLRHEPRPRRADRPHRGRPRRRLRRPRRLTTRRTRSRATSRSSHALRCSATAPTGCASPWRSGTSRTWPTATAQDAVQRAAQALGVDREVVVDRSRQACAAASVITSAEAGQRHLAQLRARAVDYDPAVRPGLLAGALLPAADYLAAQRLRAEYRDVARRVFDDVDVLLTATTPCSAPLIGQRTMDVRGEQLLVGMSLGLLAQPWALIGLPALSVPMTGQDGLPIGVQLVAAPYREASLFRVAAALERGAVLPIGRAEDGVNGLRGRPARRRRGGDRSLSCVRKAL
ncbi:MAG: amidase family protein [Nocardioidaceae bacterium]